MQTKLWPHQQEAIGTFMLLEKGILEMATGTGKTKTSLEIMKSRHVQRIRLHLRRRICPKLCITGHGLR